MTQVKIASLGELRSWAQHWVRELGAKHLVLLEGPVGAGKTQLVRIVCEELGFGGEEISSPSYSLLNHYEHLGSTLDHVDLYRLESEDDLESTGFWDLFSQPEGLIFVEWSDRIQKQYLPIHWPKTQIVFKLCDDGSRELQVESI